MTDESNPRPQIFISLHSNLILPSHLRLCLPGGFFLSGRPPKIVYAFLIGLMRAACSPILYLWFHYLNDISWRLKLWSSQKITVFRDAKVRSLVETYQEPAVPWIWKQPAPPKALLPTRNNVYSYRRDNHKSQIWKIWGLHSGRISSSGMWRCADPGLALDFSPPLTDTLPLIDIPLLPACWPSSWPYPSLSVDFQCGIHSLPSCLYIDVCFRLVAQSAATCWRWFPARGIFYPEDGGDTFLRNVDWPRIYTAPHPRRRHSSNMKFSIMISLQSSYHLFPKSKHSPPQH
jgi:hypothetical protein